MSQPPTGPPGSNVPPPPSEPLSSLPPPPTGPRAPLFERPAAKAPETKAPRRPVPLALLLGIAVLAGVAVAALIVFVGADGEGAAPTALAVPGSFAAEPGPFAVRLSWSATEGAGGYNLFRGGELLVSVSPNRRSFVDDTALPLQKLRYEIEAFAGDVTSDRGRIVVETPAAPLGQSRLNGLYRVTGHDTRNFGFVAFEGDFRTGWRFRPTCPEGPCDAAWKDVNVKGFSSVLTRQGAAYAGRDRARFGRCRNLDTNATWTIRLHVTKAEAVEGEWRATAFAGTIVQRSPAQLGCVATGADYTIKGSLRR